MNEEQLCIFCKEAKVEHSTNYAGIRNEVDGNLFPGNHETDYLCFKCQDKFVGNAENRLKQKRSGRSMPKRERSGRSMPKRERSEAKGELITPLLTKIFYTFAVLGFLGGVILYFALLPGDAGFGKEWKTVAYMASITWLIMGIVEAAIFSAVGLGLKYLHNIHLCLQRSANDKGDATELDKGDATL